MLPRSPLEARCRTGTLCVHTTVSEPSGIDRASRQVAQCFPELRDAAGYPGQSAAVPPRQSRIA